MDAGPLHQHLLDACALPHRWAGQSAWTVLDTGFAALSPFLACWQRWQADPQRPCMLHYVGMLSPTQARQLPAMARAAVQREPGWQPLAHALADATEGLPPGQHRLLLAQGQLSLTLCVGDIPAMLAEQQFLADTIWVHGEMPVIDKWHAKALARCSRREAWLALHADIGATAASLTEAGFVDLETYQRGWHVARFAPRWSLGPRDAAPAPRAAQRCTVVGAGLSGASVAYALARRGWRVTVLDRHSGPAGGASGLPAGLVVPHVSADDSPRSRMSRVGARLMQQHATALLQDGVDWHASGVEEADLEAGTSHWHATAAWIRPAHLVRAWLAHAGIQCRYGVEVAALDCQSGIWQARDATGTVHAESELLVLANATACVPLMLATAHRRYLGEGLPERLETLHAVHGTVSYGMHPVNRPPPHWPTHPWNGHGCFLPDVPLPEGRGWLAGSTFEPDHIPEQAGHRLAPLDEQHRANARRLQQLLPEVGADLEPLFAQGSVQHWSATRCVTHDRLPLVGPLQDSDSSTPATLWIHAGMGARGLTFSALGAELLAARLGGEPWPLESSLARSLDVRRPKRKRG